MWDFLLLNITTIHTKNPIPISLFTKILRMKTKKTLKHQDSNMNSRR